MQADFDDDSDDPFRGIVDGDRDLRRRLLEGDPQAWRSVYRDLRELETRDDDYVERSYPVPTDIPAGTEDKLRLMEQRVENGECATAPFKMDCPPIPPDMHGMVLEYVVAKNFQRKRVGLRPEKQ